MNFHYSPATIAQFSDKTEAEGIQWALDRADALQGDLGPDDYIALVYTDLKACKFGQIISTKYAVLLKQEFGTADLERVFLFDIVNDEQLNDLEASINARVAALEAIDYSAATTQNAASISSLSADAAALRSDLDGALNAIAAIEQAASVGVSEARTLELIQAQTSGLSTALTALTARVDDMGTDYDVRIAALEVQIASLATSASIASLETRVTNNSTAITTLTDTANAASANAADALARSATNFQAIEALETAVNADIAALPTEARVNQIIASKSYATLGEVAIVADSTVKSFTRDNLNGWPGAWAATVN